jgi:auxin influx carrier (AUX1 LAX family)
LIWSAATHVTFLNDAAAGDGKAGRFRMAREQLEEAIVADGNAKEEEVGVMGIAGAGDGDEQHGGGKFSMKSFLWHGGSVWDAWFSCASNQVSGAPSAMACALLPQLSTEIERAPAGSLALNFFFHGSWSCRWRRCS